MLKVLGIHFVGGIIAVATREFALLIPESMQIWLNIATSIIMVAYYLWAGVFLKNESLHKTIALLQALTYLGHSLFFLGESAYRFLRIATGGSVVWNRIHGQFLDLGKLSYTLTYFLTFFIFPVFIISGRIIARKALGIDIKKEGIAAFKILLCNFAASAVYPIAAAFMERFDKSGDIVTAYISLFAVICILFAGGIALRRIEWSKICFVVINFSLSGVAFMMYISKSLTNALSGGGRMINLFLETVTGKEYDYLEMLLIPLIFILLGHFAGNSFIKEPLLSVERKCKKERSIYQIVFMQLAGGLIVFYTRETALALSFESIRMAALIIISLFMAAYYVWMGNYFKKESFYKVGAVILIMTGLGFSTMIFETGIYRYLTCLTGGGSIWAGVLSKFLPDMADSVCCIIVSILIILFMGFGRIINSRADETVKKVY